MSKKENCSKCKNNKFYIHDNNLVCTECATIKIFGIRTILKLTANHFD